VRRKMEVLELKMPKNMKIVAYMAKSKMIGSSKGEFKNLIDFIKEKGVKFITLDFQLDLKNFKATELAQQLNKMSIPYFQVDIPEYAMGYIYEEIVEKEDLLNELCDEYEIMEDKDSYKGESLKNWIDMLKEEILQKEIFISLRLRPQWIVKKMLDLARKFEDKEVSFLHYVQEDICEDICPQVTRELRDVGVKVINYNVKKNLRDIIAKS